MKINESIRAAIAQYLQRNGRSCNELAVVLGVSNSTVARWYNDTASEIRNHHWVKLEPLIRPFMEPASTIRPGFAGEARTASEQVAWEKRQKRRERFICAAMTGFLAHQAVPVLRWQCVDEADHIIQLADAVMAEADKVAK